MKKIILSLVILGATHLLLAQEKENPEYKKYINKADSLYKLKDYKKSAQNYSLAFQTLGWKGSQTDRYKAARSWAMAKVPDSAFFSLERIVNRLGYSDYDKISSEEDFNSLYSDSRWQPLLETVKRNKLPSGWYRWGEEMTSYQMFLDSSAGSDGKNAMTVKSVESKIDGFGTLMQNFLADKYLGKRIRMTGFMKSKDVKGSAGFWLRVDQEKSKESLAFDNMKDRPIKGTTEWTQYEIVLDVPENASKIFFGGLLSGTGQIWFEKINFEEVSKSVPTTGRVKSEPNLDFDK